MFYNFKLLYFSMKQLTNNKKLYYILTLLLIISLYGINATNKLLVCSAFFICSLSLLSLISHFFCEENKNNFLINKPILAATVAISTNLIVTSSMAGQISTRLFFSYFGFLMAAIVANKIFSVYKNVSMHKKLAISLSIGIIADAFIMANSFLYSSKIILLTSFILRSVTYKSLFVALFVFAVFAYSKLTTSKNSSLGNKA